ncbi:MAG TPA: hypothetical protein ENI85_02295, partial [Deltaproteobacteria bacterium]|nr:hypothetical protein [Deltaproteobacteria bacterium]
MSLRGKMLALQAGALIVGLAGLALFMRSQLRAFALEAAGSQSVEAALAAANSMTWQMFAVGAVGAAALAFASSALLAPVQRRLASAVDLVDSIRNGDFSASAVGEIEGDDEIASILSGLATFRENVRDRLGLQAVDWDELRTDRVRAAQLLACVEGLPVNIMSIDRDFNLVYVNPASRDALRSLQAYLPVPVDNLIGTCIDVFHKDPSVQRRLMEDPRNLPYSTTIHLGPETLRLTATAAYDETGEYIGATAAWEVITEAEKSREDAEMLAGVLEAVARGAVPDPITADVTEDLVPMRERLNLLIASMKSITQTASALGDGDFTVDIDVRSDDDVLLTEFKTMVASLGNVLTEIRQSSSEVAEGTAQVSSTGQTLSDNASQSAASLEEISSTMEEMAGQTRQNAENANQAVSLATAARASAAGGDDQMQTMVAAMREIDESSQDISKIIKVIDEI